jgi:hypothetical protein
MHHSNYVQRTTHCKSSFFFLFDLNSTTTPIGRLMYILIVALHGARSSAGAVF